MLLSVVVFILLFTLVSKHTIELDETHVFRF